MLNVKIQQGQHMRIVSYHHIHSMTSKRLMSLGFMIGEIITIEQFSPLADPVKIQVRGVTIALRKKDLALLEVEKI
jgi:ferrous iron transport protein A